MALGLILLASVLAQAAQGSPLPGNPVLHLQPASLPVAGSAVSTWQNTASANPTIPDAVLDNTNCYQSGGVCSSPPSVVAVTNELNAVAFQSPGWIGLGNNLVVSADFSSPDTHFSLFFVGQVQSQRILGSRNSNWVLGSWYDGNAKTTFVDRAYANSAGESTPRRSSACLAGLPRHPRSTHLSIVSLFLLSTRQPGMAAGLRRAAPQRTGRNGPCGASPLLAPVAPRREAVRGAARRLLDATRWHWVPMCCAWVAATARIRAPEPRNSARALSLSSSHGKRS